MKSKKVVSNTGGGVHSKMPETFCPYQLWHWPHYQSPPPKPPSSSPKSAVSLVIDTEKHTGCQDLLCSDQDFTVYLPKKHFSAVLQRADVNWADQMSIDAEITLTGPCTNGNMVTVSGRALVARCHAGEHYSISIRAVTKRDGQGIWRKDERLVRELRHAWTRNYSVAETAVVDGANAAVQAKPATLDDAAIEALAKAEARALIEAGAEALAKAEVEPLIDKGAVALAQAESKAPSKAEAVILTELKAAALATSLNAFKPRSSREQSNEVGNYLYDFDVVSTALAQAIFPTPDAQTGLIVVAGTTGCGKTDISKALIREYLLRVGATSERRPHLVTVEDPIEDPLRMFPLPGNTNRRCPLDYTPRRLEVDVKDLRQALLDAKRMKPAIVFVGETRETNDWEELMDFAGSGHLVITTTHAGSLVETIQRIFKAVGATTPTQRGATAGSILSAIHLESVPLRLAAAGKVTRGVLPAIWKRSTSGSLGLVSDGLASILPGNPPTHEPSAIARESSLGRYWFAKRIRDQFMSLPGNDPLNAEYDKSWKRFFLKAAASDLVTL